MFVADARRARTAVALSIAVVAAAVTLSAARPTSAPARAFDAATDAWERGEYAAALNGYIQVLSSPGGGEWLEPIALTTGEWFETREITSDGRAPRFSPDGAFIAYETGLETSRRTKILRNDAARAEIADLPGVSATFSSSLPRVAYLKIPDNNDEIRRASDALAAATLTAQNRGQLTQMLAWLIAKHAAIVVRDLSTGREMELPAPDLVKTGLTFSADGRVLYFLGARERDPDRTDIFEISELAPKPVLVVDAGGLKSAPIVDPSGRALIYTVPAVNPLRRPAPPREAEPVGPIHGDFYAKQALVMDAGIALLDFDQAAVGEPAVDLGNFVAHLEREALEGRIPAERIEEMTSALLQGYGRPVSIEAWTALALFLLSTDPFRQRETRPHPPQRKGFHHSA